MKELLEPSQEEFLSLFLPKVVRIDHRDMLPKTCFHGDVFAKCLKPEGNTLNGAELVGSQ